MNPISLLTAAEQVAEHMRSQIVEQRISGNMPGIHQLAADLMVNHKTVKAALEILQRDGLLISQGRGKPRRIQIQRLSGARTLRIAILLYDPDDRKVDHILRMVSQLAEAGHHPFYAKKTLVDVGMRVSGVAGLVARTEADAWVVVAGSLPVLEWFSEQSFPVLALFGRVATVNIASAIPYTVPALREVIDHLISLGHRRIVMIARKDRRKPEPGFSEQLFLDELAAHGITTGPYNLPDWEETRGGMRSLLESLFRHTPPTALLIQGPELVTAVMMYCLHLGIKVPQQLSLVSMDPDRTFAWCSPSISHIGFDNRPLIRRIVRWANTVARGKEDRQMMTSKAEFIVGGTTGPAAKVP